MANTNRDIDKILQDIKKRKESSGRITPPNSLASISVEKKVPVSINPTPSIELKKAPIDPRTADEQRLALEQETIARQRLISQQRLAIEQRAVKQGEDFEENTVLAHDLTTDDQLLAENKAAEKKAAEKRIAQQRASLEEQALLAQQLATQQQLLAEKKAAEKRIAQQRASLEERAILERQLAAQQQLLAEKKAAEKHDTQQSASLEERAILERQLAVQQQLLDEKRAAEKRVFEQRAADIKPPIATLATSEVFADLSGVVAKVLEPSFTPQATAPKSRSMADVQRLISEIKKEKSDALPNNEFKASSMPQKATASPTAVSRSAVPTQPTAVSPVAAPTQPTAVSRSAAPTQPTATRPSTPLSTAGPSFQGNLSGGGELHDAGGEDFLAKLASVLNDKTTEEKPLQAPAAPTANKAVPAPTPSALFDKDKQSYNPNIDKLRDDEAPREQMSSESFIDDKFVDFFTQSIIVPHEQESQINVHHKKRGFFKKRYITDSLSLAIPEEDIKRAEQSRLFKREKDTVRPAAPAKQSFDVPEETATIDLADDGHQNMVSDITAMFLPQSPDVAPDIANIKSPRELYIPKEPKPEPVFEEYTLGGKGVSEPPVEEDPEEILRELGSFKTTLVVRFSLGIICAVVLLYLNFSANIGFPLPPFMSPTAQPLVFYTVSIVFYAIALLGFLPTISNGFVGIFKASTSDSFLSLASMMCLLQLVLAILQAENIETKTSTIFAGFLVLALSLNALGKLICTNTISRNLSLADVPDGINAGYTVKDPEAVKKLSRTLGEKSPQILVSRKTGSITNFISGGFSSHSSEKNAKQIAIFTYVVTFVCFVIGYFTSKDITVAIFTAAGASVLTLPLSHTLISSVPSSLMQKALKQVGALVNGWQGIDQLSSTTHVSFDAKHLFPKGSVVLHGIKTFEKERLDLAILYASSIAIEKCDNLRHVFLNVIENKTDMLFPLESCEYKVGQGYIAWIEHNRVIMGNRNIMSQFDIDLPPVSLETRFTAEGKKPIYLSVNGKLFGMFVVSYHADPSVKENLDRLIQTGINVILQSNDFNIDSQLLELVYRLPSDTVQVLNQNETALLLNYTQYSETTESCVAHLDSLYSLVAGFCGADSAKSAASTCSIVQTVSVVIGAVLAVIFAYSQTMPAIPLLSVTLLGLGWMGLCLMRALAKKYY